MIKRLVVVVILALVVGSGIPILQAQEEQAEVPVTLIDLTGPAAGSDAELSGLAWYGDTLFLLAENPNLYAEEDSLGAFFALEKADLMAYLDGEDSAALEPVPVPVFADQNFVSAIPGFDGFEAVTFVDDTIYLMIEAVGKDATMRGFLLKGSVSPGLSEITLDVGGAVEIAPQTEITNMAYENLFAVEDRIVTIYEINGVGVNPQPVAYVFDLDLNPLGTIPFPNLEYRLTDVTAPDEDGLLWGINYFFPGEDVLLPESDPLVELYGQGATHARYPHVERLVAFQYAEDGITLVDQPPIQLELIGEDARNWEGIARLDDRGFVLVTDKYPQTLLGFVPH